MSNETNEIAAPEFNPFPKIARWSRDVVITEKIDGTNASVHFSESGEMRVASRTQWITPARDNHGFAAWAFAHRAELERLGPGAHFGEWWGAGIQRKYGLTEKRFSLFNVSKWEDPAARPECCHVVPVLWRGPMDAAHAAISDALGYLCSKGSIAAPGFMKPEGIVLFHVAAGQLFKKTLEKDEAPKSLTEATHGN